MNNIPLLVYLSALLWQGREGTPIFVNIALLVFVSVGRTQHQQDQIPAIPGAPGRDYPAFTSPPKTSFTCEGLSPGYYSDPEGECQVYHHCTHAVAKPSFTRLCPVGNTRVGQLEISPVCYHVSTIGTLYNQQYFICDWWFNVDCSTVEDFYSLNDDVAAAQIEAGRK